MSSLLKSSSPFRVPPRYQAIWRRAEPLLKVGRAGDWQHARETVQTILNYRGRLKFDPTVMIPVAMMHDIGHYAILPEHFKFITGPAKVKNSKLVHMLAGAKIARDILRAVHYPAKKTAEIVEIISIHDADNLEGVDLRKIYNTANKKFFHDIDSLDRYTEDRLRSFQSMYSRPHFLRLLAELSDNFFYDEFKRLAKQRLQALG
ncbi:MAG: hypothetical protein WC453_00450 [Patescibacteria group bacterium]